MVEVMKKGDIVTILLDKEDWVGIIVRIERRVTGQANSSPYSVTSVEESYGVNWLRSDSFWSLNWGADELQLYDVKQNYEI